MNCVVGAVRSADQILRIQSCLCSVHNIVLADRIHVVHNQPTMDFTTFNGEIAPAVSSDYVSSK